MEDLNKVELQFLDKYIGIQHNYETYNCVCLIYDIYTKEFNLNLNEYELFNLSDRFSVNKSDLNKYSLDLIDEKLKSWIKISLTNLELFDILIFSNPKKNKFRHMGMYCGQNKFLHLPENSISTISLFEEKYRQRFYAGYRCKQLHRNTF